jgi:sigma-E factor negative regulatory protein RseA
VVVQTTQGQVLRDPRLEQLLAEHRQFGGMSALQAPAGFLRNATYDSSPQR